MPRCEVGELLVDAVDLGHGSHGQLRERQAGEDVLDEAGVDHPGGVGHCEKDLERDDEEGDEAADAAEALQQQIVVAGAAGAGAAALLRRLLLLLAAGVGCGGGGRLLGGGRGGCGGGRGGATTAAATASKAAGGTGGGCAGEAFREGPSGADARVGEGLEPREKREEAAERLGRIRGGGGSTSESVCANDQATTTGRKRGGAKLRRQRGESAHNPNTRAARKNTAVRAARTAFSPRDHAPLCAAAPHGAQNFPCLAKPAAHCSHSTPACPRRQLLMIPVSGFSSASASHTPARQGKNRQFPEPSTHGQNPESASGRVAPSGQRAPRGHGSQVQGRISVTLFAPVSADRGLIPWVGSWGGARKVFAVPGMHTHSDSPALHGQEREDFFSVDARSAVTSQRNARGERSD